MPHRAAELAPKARVEIMPNAGHFPHKDHPERFVKILNDFVRTTSPATYSRARWRRLLQQGARALGRAAPGRSRLRPPECPGIIGVPIDLLLGMELAEALEAARATHQSVLTTLRRDGKPQLSNVLHTARRRRRDPGEHDHGPGEVPQPPARALGGAEGRRRQLLVVRRDRGRRDVLRGRRRPRTTRRSTSWSSTTASISGEHPDWDDYRRAMVADHRVVARLTPTRAYGALR